MWRMVSTVCFVALALSATAFGLPPVNEPPATVSNMRLTLGGTQVANMRDCGPFGSETEVLEQTVSLPNGQQSIRKLPGRTRYPNVVCTAILTTDTTLADWREDVEQGQINTARKDGSFDFFNLQGQQVLSYSFTNAWPSKLMVHWEGSASTSPVTEEIEIVIESLTRQ